MKVSVFPPGDIRFDSGARQHCIWRETSLALHLIRQAVNPKIGLAQALSEWNRLSADLAEPPRKGYRTY